MLVADASVIAPVVADGGHDGAQLRRRLRGEHIAAPDLLRIEVVSVIRRQLQIGTIDTAQAEHALADLLELPVAVFCQPGSHRCVGDGGPVDVGDVPGHPPRDEPVERGRTVVRGPAHRRRRGGAYAALYQAQFQGPAVGADVAPPVPAV